MATRNRGLKRTRPIQKLPRRAARAAAPLSDLATRAAQLAEAQELSRVGSWEWDIATNRVTWSEELYRIYGIQPGGPPLTYEEVVACMHPDDRDLLRKAVTAAVENGSAYRVEHRILKPDGTVTNVLGAGRAVKDSSGRVVRLFGVAQDITERKASEAALREKTRILQSVLESIGDGVLVVDTHGRFLVFNPAAERLAGIERSERVPESWSRAEGVLMPDGVTNYPSSRLPLVQALEGRDVNDAEFFLKRGNSDAIFLSASARPMRDEKGEVIGAVGVFRDARARREAQEALREQKEFTESLVTSSVDGILAFDRDRRFTVWNPAMEALSGLTREEVIGRRAGEEVPFLKETGDDRFFQAALEGRTVSARERPYRIPSTRREGYFEGRFSPLRDRSGAIVGGLASIRDVTERVRLADQMRRAQKLESIGALAGGVAHDFNNILNIIAAYVSLARKKAAGQPPDSHLDAIHQAVERGAGVVRQLLSVAQRTDSVLQSVEVNEILRELSRLLGETLPRGITIALDLVPDLPKIAADGDQLHQAILNLCVNARDAMPNGGTLTLKTELCTAEDLRPRMPSAESGRYACVSVTDTGTGMDEETKGRIFEPFFTTKERGVGSGLGLAVVYGVVRSHGGLVHVETTPGRGTTFTLCFPMTDQPYAASTDPPASEVSGGSETILLVEDEPMLLVAVRGLLEEEGYRVISASDGVEAVELHRLHGPRISLVIADVGLPRLGGWEAFQKMKESDPGVRAILVSGILETEMRVDFTAGGVKHSLRKPYMAEELLRKIRDVLDGASGF